MCLCSGSSNLSLVMLTRGSTGEWGQYRGRGAGGGFLREGCSTHHLLLNVLPLCLPSPSGSVSCVNEPFPRARLPAEPVYGPRVGCGDDPAADRSQAPTVGTELCRVLLDCPRGGAMVIALTPVPQGHPCTCGHELTPCDRQPMAQRRWWAAIHLFQGQLGCVLCSSGKVPRDA